MRWKLVLFFCFTIVLSNLSFAVDESLFDYHALTLDVTLNNNFQIVSRSTDGYVQKLTATMSWYPLDDFRQDVAYINTVPAGEFKEGRGFLFEWTRPPEKDFRISQNSKITTSSDFLQVKKKISFPLKDLDPEYARYLEPGEITDVNNDIRSLASSIAQGESDTYIITAKLAQWVEENVNYDLSTTTADASQKSSWVLANRVGVCDELTSLFISLCRSVGIPARFVSGISYSNVNLANDGWGPHGWAEVYFPDYGWVPFDVTYKELGYLDPTHIKLKESHDAKETSIEYSTVGQDVDVKPGSLDFEVNVIGKDYLSRPKVSVDVNIAESETGFGSYNLVEVTVKNMNDYYVTGRLKISNVSEISIIGSNSISYVILPGSEKKFYWVIKVSDSLNQGYVYTFPINIYGDGVDVPSSFKASSRGNTYSEEYMTSLVPKYESNDKPYSKYVDLSCSPDKKDAYAGEVVNITCNMRNDASQEMVLNSCMDKNCTKIVLAAMSSRQFSYTINFTSLGVKTLTIAVDGALASKTAYVVVPIIDEPRVFLVNLSYPEKVGYKDPVEMEFLLKRDSVSDARNIVLRLDHELVGESWSFGSLENNYALKYLFKGSDLLPGKNDFTLYLSYEDARGKKYSVTKEFSINLENLTLWQKIILWFNRFDIKLTRWIQSMT